MLYMMFIIHTTYLYVVKRLRPRVRYKDSVACCKILLVDLLV